MTDTTTPVKSSQRGTGPARTWLYFAAVERKSSRFCGPARSGLAQQLPPPVRKISFGTTATRDLGKCGVTDAQRVCLEKVLPLIRIDVQGYAPNGDVRDAVKHVHDAVVQAHNAVRSMQSGIAAAEVEALGHLASGAASITDPHAVVRDIESATEGAVPEIVDIPTLLELLVLAAKRGLYDVPTTQYRRAAPVKAIVRVLAALHRPDDDESRRVATKLQAKLTGKAFIEVCTVALRTANGDEDVPIESAIRGFKATHRLAADGRRWVRIGNSPPENLT